MEIPANDPIVAIERQRVLPVLSFSDFDDAEEVSVGLIEAGHSVLEITLRTPIGLEAIARAAAYGAVVGAGTVLSAAAAADAVAAGASFVVSPGWDDAVVDYCLAHGVTVLPGVATPSEAMRALSRGLRVMKFFPASVAGGPSWLAALAAPLPEARFVATGGVSQSSAAEYLRTSNVVAIGGSWFVGSERKRSAVAASARSALSALEADLAGSPAR